MRRARMGALVVGLAACLSGPASVDAEEPDAQSVQSDPFAFTLRTSIKSSLLASHAPDDPILFPERDSAVSFWRVRIEPTMKKGERLTLGGAYEQRLRVFNTAPGLSGGGVLPDEADALFRIRQLDWSLSARDGLSWRHEVDRAFVAVKLPSDATVTIGRQAIGWGRGVMFGAVDLFAPFSPLEADREWRRGVDAARIEVPISDRTSVDGVAAFGRSIPESAFAGRLRGYAGKADLELVGGRRARDLFGGVTTSAALGQAEVHGEAAAFGAHDVEVTGDTRTVAKLVAGGSYRFAIGPGVLTFVEYHYSGFGVAQPEELIARLSTPVFLTRVLRGDTQILGRHAIAATVSSELSPEWSVSGQWLHSPADGSGVAVPSAVYSLGDTTSMLVSVYVPYGRAPMNGVLRSEHGSQGLTVFAQMRVYR